MNFEQAQAILFNAPYGHQKGRAGMMMLLDFLGHPEEDLRFIHIAGTNGKGSTGSFMRALLNQAGLKVGHFMSPHLFDYRERMTIDGRIMSEDQLIECVQEMKIALDVMRDQHALEPTYFELSLVLALLHFSNEAVDFVILEAGLGGTHDATNFMPNVHLSVITPIAFDHIHELGTEIDEIARHKAGIIKAGVPCISAPQDYKVKLILMETAEKHGSHLQFLEDIDLHDLVVDGKGTRFKLWDEPYFIRLTGKHQAENAALAIRALEILEILLSPDDIRTALAQAKLGGRFQFLSHKPDIVVDGAHNAQGMEALFDTLIRVNGHEPIVLVLGAMRDKDLGDKFFHILNLAQVVYLTEPESGKARHATEWTFNHPNVQSLPMKAAFEAAKANAQGRLVLITGSLYLVGSAIEHYGLDL